MTSSSRPSEHPHVRAVEPLEATTFALVVEVVAAGVASMNAVLKSVIMMVRSILGLLLRRLLCLHGGRCGQTRVRRRSARCVQILLFSLRPPAFAGDDFRNLLRWSTAVPAARHTRLLGCLCCHVGCCNRTLSLPHVLASLFPAHTQAQSERETIKTSVKLMGGASVGLSGQRTGALRCAAHVRRSIRAQLCSCVHAGVGEALSCPPWVVHVI